MKRMIIAVLFAASAWLADACTVVTPADAYRLGSIVSAPNTTFCLQPGTYRLRSTATIGDGSTVYCATRRQCIIDGRGTVAIGLATAYGATAPNTVRGFVVKRFTASCVRTRPLGVVDDNELTACETGVEANGKVVGNWIHHNKRYGVSGGPAIDILIENNEISFNNTSRFDPEWDAGGSKIVGTRDPAGAFVTWRNNRVHDNYGRGIWNDGNVKSLIESNTVWNNTSSGIDHEIGWDAVIRWNTIYGNASSVKGLDKSCWEIAQVAFNNSQNVELYGNLIIADGTNAICLQNVARSEVAPFPTSLANFLIRNNDIRLSGAAHVGYVGDIVPPNIRFTNNTYTLAEPSRAYWQSPTGSYKTFTQWQAAGQDIGSTVQ